ncbi:MAG: NAD(P)H-dependent glycerol-3-phosphate dehydrogenase [Alphaproteobacteria bacterium]
MNRIAVVGAGAWGTALALVARRAGHDVTLWAREPEVVSSIAQTRRNAMFLPQVELDPAIVATLDLAQALHGAETILLVTPAQHTRAVASSLRGAMPKPASVVICAKGIEQGSGALMSEAVEAALPGVRWAVLSGPTFAVEVARGLPTAVTVAADDPALADEIVATLGGAAFRPYASSDPIGAQIGGAVKNVIAIACGIVQGRGMGDNARAALITRGLAEMVRLGLAKGAAVETLMGLSGLGDLTLTCNGAQSRNLSLGIGLGQGKSLGEVLKGRNSVAEGVATAASVVALAQRLQVDMPIVGAVHAILHQGAEIDRTVATLLSRPFKAETAR